MTQWGGNPRDTHRRVGRNGVEMLSPQSTPIGAEWGAPPLGVPHAPTPQRLGALTAVEGDLPAGFKGQGRGHFIPDENKCTRTANVAEMRFPNRCERRRP